MWEFFSLGVAVIAAIIALRANDISNKARREAKQAINKANELQSQLVDIETARERDRRAEQQRANLRYDITTSGTTKRVRIMNEGPGQALDVKLTTTSNTVILTGAFPNVLDAGSTASFQYGTTSYTPSPSFTLEWRNPSGEPGRLTGHLEVS